RRTAPNYGFSLHPNRAVVRLQISQFDGALSDCEKVLSCQPKNKKAMHFKVRALYLLRQYKKSTSACQALLAEFPDAVDTKLLLESCRERVQESTKGAFDFCTMHTEASRKRNCQLDFADYIGPAVTRRGSEAGRGKGMFAKRHISQGELLLCEKALMMGHFEKDGFPMSVRLSQSQIAVGPHALLPSRITQFLYENPSKAGPFLRLFSPERGGRSSQLSYTPEGDPIIDAFAVTNIVQHNAFQVEHSIDFDEKLKVTVTDEFNSDCGL
ncbi:hypothetical protein BGW36DRAFT_443161, partial [Talaromyces proteolyticus]